MAKNIPAKKPIKATIEKTLSSKSANKKPIKEPIFIDNISLKNFKCFENFAIKNLKRVNIFVGDNNSGKTSLLEAIGFLSPNLLDHDKLYRGNERDSISTLFFLNARAKETRIKKPESETNIGQRYVSLSGMIGLIWKRFVLKVSNLYYQSNYSDIPIIEAQFKKLNQPKIELKVNLQQKLDTEFLQERVTATYQFSNKKDPAILGISPFASESIETYETKIDNFNDYHIIYKSPATIDDDNIKKNWDKIIKYDADKIKEKYIKLLKNFDPDISDIIFDKDGLMFFQKHNSKNKFNVPLSAMGDGFKKFFDIVLSLDLAKNKDVPTILCIDEIDNGLYFAKQDLFWEQILKLCDENNIQIFATTHSYDAVASLTKSGEKLYKTSARFDEFIAVYKLYRTKLEDNLSPIKSFYYDCQLLKAKINSTIELR